MIKKIIYLFVCISLFNCEETKKEDAIPVGTQFDFDWKAANIYFLLTDRFNNGDTLNDVNFERTGETGKLRGFEGGDIKGVTQKIKDGYFTCLLYTSDAADD